MISRLRGTVREIRELQILLEVNGIGYDVFIPSSIHRLVPELISDQGDIELVTFHYHQLEIGRGVPVLIGFFNEVEREFFVRFISVAGIGPKAALKAFALPIATIAQAIDDGDLSLLRSLPGIGEQRAKEIVAKLQGKVGKYALIQTKASLPESAGTKQRTVEDEALAILEGGLLEKRVKRSSSELSLAAALFLLSSLYSSSRWDGWRLTALLVTQ